MTKFIPEFSYHIESAEEMQPGTYAYYVPTWHELHIAENVYERACTGIPRDRFTIAHELAHAFLLYKSPIYLARLMREAKCYHDPEWQANEFAAELLAPCHEIQSMPLELIMSQYQVSARMAQIQINKNKSASWN